MDFMPDPSTAPPPPAGNGGDALTLRNLHPGQHARVRGYRDDDGDGGAYKEQLLRLGLIPGTRLEVLRRAAFGRLIEIRFRGYSLALRPGEADCLLLEPL